LSSQAGGFGYAIKLRISAAGLNHPKVSRKVH